VAACERCRGAGFEIVTVRGHDDKDVEVARPCECRRPGRAESEDQVLRSLRVPPRYEHCILATFEPGTKRQTEALDKVLRYCKDYPTRGTKHLNDQGLGLLLTGSNGTGKTHLAVAALRELASVHGVRGQFWDYHELLREIRRSYDATTALTEYEALEPIIDMEVLLLDDLGAWKMTDWMKDILFYILNRRYLARRPSLITTNYPDKEPSPAQIQQADRTIREEYLVERIGWRLRSRLLEACAVLQLDGPDRRQFALQASNQTLLS
jgi:DNA replication protein DnaC